MEAQCDPDPCRLVGLARRFEFQLSSMAVLEHWRRNLAPLNSRKQLCTRIDFIRNYFEVLEEMGLLDEIPEGQPFIYNTVHWPEGVEPGGYASQRCGIRHSHIVATRLGNRELSIARRGGTYGRLLRSAAPILRKSGFEGAFQFLLQVQLSGMVFDDTSAVSAMLSLSTIRAMDPLVLEPLLNDCVGDAATWIDEQTRFEKANSSFMLDYLTPVFFDQVERLRNARSLDDWLLGQCRVHVLCRQWQFTFSHEFSNSPPASWNVLNEIIEEILADTGAFLLVNLGDSALALSGDLSNVLGLVLIIEARDPANWRSRIFEERMLVPNAHLPDIFESMLQGTFSVDALPEEWQCLSTTLGPLVMEMFAENEVDATRTSSGQETSMVDKNHMFEELRAIIELSRTERWSESAELLKTLVKKFPWCDLAYGELAICLDMMNLVEQAAIAIENAIVICPTNAAHWQSYSVILRNLGASQAAGLASLVCRHLKSLDEESPR